jgi:hypothetical protein
LIFRPNGLSLPISQNPSKGLWRIGPKHDPKTSEISYSPDYQEIRDFNWPNIIDIALQTNEKDVVYDEDLIELVGELGNRYGTCRKIYRKLYVAQASTEAEIIGVIGGYTSH